MNRAKIEKLKKNIKHYAPEIIAGTSVVAGVVALICLRKQETEVLLTLSPDEWTKISSGDAVKIVTDAGPIFLAKEVHTV